MGSHQLAMVGIGGLVGSGAIKPLSQLSNSCLAAVHNKMTQCAVLV